jgi:protein TonB
MSTDYQRLQDVTSQHPLLDDDAHGIRWWAGRAALVSGGIVLVLVGFVAGHFLTRQKPDDSSSSFRLNAIAAGLDVQVTWNPASTDIQNARRGSLVILDSSDGNRVELNPVQLKSGHYEYSPLHHDVTFLMTVYRRDNSFVGETKSIHLDDIARSYPPDEAATRNNLARSMAQGKPQSADKSRIESRSGSTVPGAEAGNYANDSNPTAAPRKSAALPPALARLALAPRMETPPEIGAVTGLPQTIIPGSSVRPAAPVVVTPPVAPAAADRTLTYSSPVPIRRANPEITPAVRSLIHDNVSVRITVDVDAEGNVTDARPLDARSFDERLLARHAVQAARLWRFEPARRDGAPVPGETVVVFDFGGR